MSSVRHSGGSGPHHSHVVVFGSLVLPSSVRLQTKWFRSLARRRCSLSAVILYHVSLTSAAFSPSHRQVR
jgi:hypothetical protein